MIGRCHDCKHWRNHVSRGWHQLMPPPGWGVCRKTITDNANPADDATLAYVFDDVLPPGGYTALKTAPDFGCVQFEER